MSSIPFTVITFFTFFFFFFFFFLSVTAPGNFNQSLTKKPRKNPTSLVVGLTHSRALKISDDGILSWTRTKKVTSSSMYSDVVEPLREIRDGYLISLKLGTPPKVIQVYMDTGSDLTWVPCGNLSFDCMECDEYRNNKLMSTYSPSYSSSSLRDFCLSPFCNDVHSSDNSYDPCVVAGCSLTTLVKGTCPRPCPSFAYTYGAGGVIIGTLTRDTLATHGTRTQEVSEVHNYCFGCVGSTFREPIGIAGFGRGALSLPSQLGFLHKGFSHCFLPFRFSNNPNISSPLVIGDLAISSDEHLQFTPLLRSPMYPNYYYIGLEGISIGNGTTILRTQAPSSLREFDSHGNGGMIIDSGTTYTHLPEPFYSQILSSLQSIITYPRAKEMEKRSGFDLCYKIPCPNHVVVANYDEDDHLLPWITFHFSNDVSVVLPQGNYLYAMGPPSNYSVVKCLLVQRMDEGDESGPAGVFGSFQQHDVKVVYDLEKERIGFHPMDCASAAVSQGLGHKLKP